jgi:hypothetical protein
MKFFFRVLFFFLFHPAAELHTAHEHDPVHRFPIMR